MRKALVAVAMALAVLLTPTAASAAQPPYFTEYLVCFNGHVYTDFTDPDGNDEYLNVQLAVYRPHLGYWTYHWMTNTGPSAHGIFFWAKLADHGIDPATVSWYAFNGVDQEGLWSGWTYADSRCNIWRGLDAAAPALADR